MALPKRRWQGSDAVTDGDSPNGNSDRRFLVALILFALLIRLLAVVGMPHGLQEDPDAYRRFATTLARHGVYGPEADRPSAYRPPLYPLLLSVFCGRDGFFVAGVVLLHSLAVAATVVGTCRLSGIVAGPRASWLAGMAVAIDPLSIWLFTAVMTEVVFTALLVGCLTAWYHVRAGRDEAGSRSVESAPDAGVAGRSVGVGTTERHQSMTKVVSPGATGLVLALAALTRPTVWALWLALGIDACLRRRLGAWCHATLVALACCLPWAWRNAAVLGAWIFTTTHGGYTLWLGQNPAFFADEVAGAKRVWSDESFRTWSQENDRLTLHLDEVERDRTFRRLALDWMATHPQAALASMVHHVKTMWSPLPRTPLPVVLKWGVGAYYLVLFGLVLIGTLRRGVPFVRVRPLGIVVIALTAVHAVYWSNQRMRAPLTPALAVLAATAFVPRRPSLTSSVTRS